METNHYNCENDIFEGDLEDDHEPYEPAIWYEEDYGSGSYSDENRPQW